MDAKFLLIGAVVVGALLVYYKPLRSLWLVKKRCSATVQGNYVYSEGYYRSMRGGAGETLMIPVYEYSVDGKLYLAMIEGMMQAYNVFPLKVEVQYNPADPEVCFVEGKRGTILKRK